MEIGVTRDDMPRPDADHHPRGQAARGAAGGLILAPAAIEYWP